MLNNNFARYWLNNIKNEYEIHDWHLIPLFCLVLAGADTGQQQK
jgi:hypothetical protein